MSALGDARCVVGGDTQVPLLDGRQVPYLNLDNAASTPSLRVVLDRVVAFMDWYSSVHRGSGHKSRVATQAYEDARAAVAGFVGATEHERTVIFGKNATEALNKLSFRLALTPDDVVLVSRMEHHSNDLPWRARAHVVHVDVDAFGRLDEDHLDSLLREHAGRVRLLALSGGSNVTGVLPDVHGAAEKAHAAGAQIVVDAAQRAPHRAIAMGELADPRHLDYVVLSAHKLYAPFGTGALIGRRDTFETGAPEYRGGGTIEFVSTDSVTWAAGPDRDEAGSPNVVGAVALAAALKWLRATGLDMIAGHERDLTAHALRAMPAVPGLRLYGDADPRRAGERLGVIPFALGDLPHGYVAAVLSQEHGIGVRSGCFCAHPYLAHLLGLTRSDVQRVQADLRAGDRREVPGLVRVSFGLYNNESDVDRLVQALHAIARGEVQGRYTREASTGDFVARAA